MLGVQRAVEHIITPEKPGIKNTITYRWKSSAGTNMYIHVGTDEFGVLDSMILNVGSSGTTVHNLANTLGRVVSIAIQDNKATALDIVQTIEGVSSEVVWRSDDFNETAESIPGVIAQVLLRHIDIETTIENMHSGLEISDEETPMSLMPDEESTNI